MPADPTPAIVAELKNAEAVLGRAGRAVGAYLRKAARVTEKYPEGAYMRHIGQAVIYEDLSKELAGAAEDLTDIASRLAEQASITDRLSLKAAAEANPVIREAP